MFAWRLVFVFCAVYAAADHILYIQKKKRYTKKEKIYYIHNIDLSTLFAKEHGSLSLSSLKQIN